MVLTIAEKWVVRGRENFFVKRKIDSKELQEQVAALKRKIKRTEFLKNLTIVVFLSSYLGLSIALGHASQASEITPSEPTVLQSQSRSVRPEVRLIVLNRQIASFEMLFFSSSISVLIFNVLMIRELLLSLEAAKVDLKREECFCCNEAERAELLALASDQLKRWYLALDSLPYKAIPDFSVSTEQLDQFNELLEKHLEKCNQGCAYAE